MSKKSHIKFCGETVLKTPLKWADIVFDREIGWLKKFQSNRFPKLLDVNYDSKTIIMSYCGERINKKNCPSDWADQAEDILNELNKYKCNHNDISFGEVLVMDSEIYLIDFGWATEFDEGIPNDWPINLGQDFRLDIHKFDDRYAIYSVIESIIK